MMPAGEMKHVFPKELFKTDTISTMPPTVYVGGIEVKDFNPGKKRKPKF